MIIKTAILLLVTIIRCEILNVPLDYPTIQNAINFSSENDTILISPGTYYENLVIDDISINFLSSSGAETTIIDGSSVYSPVFTFNNISGSFELNGLTIQNGTGLIINGASYGGGILSNNSNISINNMVIQNNFAFAGGGICFYATLNSNTFPTINNTQIKNNLASEGGGIFCVNHTLAIFNTDITRNGMDLFGSGGGIQALLSEISIQNSKINLNETKFGGGIYISNSNSDISNTLIENNYSDSKGGGIWVGGNTNLEIVKSIISDNYSSGFGGGIFNSLSNTTITNSNIVKNTVSSNVSGAGIYIDGGNSIINNSIIYFNYNDNTFNNPNYNIDGYSSNNFYEYNITFVMYTGGAGADGYTKSYRLAKNNWYHFLIDFGGANKLQDAKKGGSEGEGRQTFMLNSGIATFFGISIDSTSDNRPSIFGMSYFGSRKVNGVTFPAFSSFGKKIQYEGNDECIPVTDPEKAKEFISLFNLKRKISDPGTSIIIPFYNKEEISSEFIIERLINIYRVPIFRDELEVFVEGTQINSENIRSLVDAREESPGKKMLYQDYFNFLEESKLKVPEENIFEINFYDLEEITKENISNFENLIAKYNENKILKLKLSFQIKKLRDNIRYDEFGSTIDIYIKKYPSNLDNIRETYNDFVRGQMPLYARRNKKTSMFHLVNIQNDHAMLLFKHAEQANHSEISADNWKLRDHYKNYKPIIRLSKNITVKLYNLITSENLEEDYEATQDLFKIDDRDKGQTQVTGGGADENDENSAGQKLAKKYEVERAPFFIVEDEQNSITIYTVYFKFIKEIFGGKTTESDIAKDILDADNNLDFI